MLKAEGRRLKARKAKSELSAAVLAALFFCAACDGGDVVPGFRVELAAVLPQPV